MNIQIGGRIKELRKELGLSQEEFAEKISISVRHLSRLENNQINVDISSLMNIMDALGESIDNFGPLFVDSKEFHQYDASININKLGLERKWDAFDKAISKADTGLLDNPRIGQVLAYFDAARKLESVGGPTPTFTKDDLEKLYDIMRMSKKDFAEERVSEYLLTPLESWIINDMCIALSCIGEPERAINLAKALVDNKSVKARYAEVESDSLYHQSVLYLAEVYQKLQMPVEALSLLTKFHRDCIGKNNTLVNSGYCLSAIALLYGEMGENEAIIKPYAIRAYHWLVMMGFLDYSIWFKNEFKRLFNIDI
jgi:transcriptional regulator with XRE-family HTH domain